MREFIELVQKMRDAQKRYFKLRDREALIESKRLEFTKRYPRMDLIANLNGRTYKMQRGAREKGLAASTYENFYGLGENCSTFLRLFHKSHGLISTLSNNGHSHFVRLILRNIPTRDYKAWGWFHLNSPQAQRVYHWLENSNGHSDGQLSFL